MELGQQTLFRPFQPFTTARSFRVLPPGNTLNIVIPPGTWTIQTLFSVSRPSPLPNNEAFTYDPTGDSYLIFDGVWYNAVTFDPANDVPLAAGQTFDYANSTGANVVLWNSDP